MTPKNSVDSADVLLVGSVPFETVDEVFDTCGAAVGEHLFGMPDGEVGERSTWVMALPHMSYDKCPDLEPIQAVAPDDVISPDSHDTAEMAPTFGTYKVKEGVTETVFDLHFGPEAVSSYDRLVKAREEGRVPEGVRFQVCIPFTLDATMMFFPEPSDAPVVAAAYVRGVHRTLEMILERVPADDLVIQWDYCAELLHIIGALDELSPVPLTDTTEERFAMLTSKEFVGPLSAALPDEVVLGYHICYGTWGGWPVGRVLDMGICVRVANALSANTPHRVDYFHLPSMPDPPEGFFAPLADLDVGTARTFLGLELADGVDALLDRARQAREHLPDFGLSHYCGYGREEPDDVRKLLDDIRTGAESLATS